MKPRALLFCLVILAVDHVHARGATQPDLLQSRYAHALRAFNPHLSRATASMLATTTIAVSDAQHLDARLLVALVATESSWHRNARSPVGARGLGQLMPATAHALGVNPDDPMTNLQGAAIYLRHLLNIYATSAIPHRYELALAAYNAGSGAVARFGGIPPYPETQRYVATVMARWAALVGASRV